MLVVRKAITYFKGRTNHLAQLHALVLTSLVFVCADPFEFDIQLIVEDVTKQIVSLSWTGVPTPHQVMARHFSIGWLGSVAKTLSD